MLLQEPEFMMPDYCNFSNYVLFTSDGEVRNWSSYHFVAHQRIIIFMKRATVDLLVVDYV
jgi:hypothetical protein